MKIVSIILLNYNGAYDTLECLKSLACISYTNYHITVVDNCSTDDSINIIKNYFSSSLANNYIHFSSIDEAMNDTDTYKHYTLIQLDSNKGYGYGNNIGINYALYKKTDYVFILNNDTIVKKHFLEPMVEVCENDSTIGIVSSKIYFYDKTNYIWFNGGSFSPCSASVKHNNFNEKDIGQVALEPTTFISGCAWLIPKKVFKSVGLINEDYFMYIEDVEFCQRVLNKNLRLKVLSEGLIYHKVGRSTGGRFSSFSLFWRTKNMNKLISTTPNILCKTKAYILFNSKTVFQILRSKKFYLLKDYFKAITTKESHVT